MMHWEGYLQTSRGTCSQTFFGTSWHFSYGTRFLTFAQTSFGTLVQVVWGVTTFTLWHEVFPSDLAHWGMQSGWMPRLQIFSQFSRICWKQAGSYSVVYPFSHLVSSTTLHSYFSFSVKVSSQTILYSLWHSSWKVFVQDFTGILSVFLPESEANEDDRGDSDSLVDPKNILLFDGLPDWGILCSEIFGSDLNGCLLNPLPDGVASKTRGGPDCARLGDLLDCCLIRGDDGFPVFPLNKLAPDERGGPGLDGLPRFISSRSGADCDGPEGTAGITEN